MSPRLAYRPKGEEIDGSFVIAERTVLLEAKWTSELQPASALYQFTGKISGKLVGTVGLFVSMSGVFPDAIDAHIAGIQLNLILVDGDDLRVIARDDITINTAIRAKLCVAAETGAPFFAVDPGAQRRRTGDTRLTCPGRRSYRRANPDRRHSVMGHTGRASECRARGRTVELRTNRRSAADPI